jgi:cell volume regulation protein A
VAVAFLAFALPTLLDGSGFLSVYVCGMLLGGESIRYRAGLLRVHDALAWLSQVTMFLVLGLLVFPSRLVQVGWVGLGLSLFLAFVARPLVVWLLLLPFRYPAKEVVYISWVGLRGAVPITLATFPVMAGAPGASRLFDIVFFIVVVNALIPGATVRWITRRLGLSGDAPPTPPAALEMTSTQMLRGELLPFYIRSASAVCGATLAELPFPESAVAALIVRGDELVPPKGNTRLQMGDHVYVFCSPEDLDLVRLLFGSPESE